MVVLGGVLRGRRCLPVRLRASVGSQGGSFSHFPPADTSWYLFGPSGTALSDRYLIGEALRRVIDIPPRFGANSDIIGPLSLPRHHFSVPRGQLKPSSFEVITSPSSLLQTFLSLNELHRAHFFFLTTGRLLCCRFSPLPTTRCPFSVTLPEPPQQTHSGPRAADSRWLPMKRIRRRST